MFQPAFGCAQHPKAGRKAQHAGHFWHSHSGNFGHFWHSHSGNFGNFWCSRFGAQSQPKIDVASARLERLNKNKFTIFKCIVITIESK